MRRHFLKAEQLPILKIDLHVHTKYSDSTSSVEDILEAARQRGLDGVALTDHDKIGGWISVFKSSSDLLVIPGIEVTTKDGHLLLIGIKEAPPKRLDAVTVSDYARNRGGVVIVPHPKIPFISIREHVIELIRPDAIESINAQVPFEYLNRESGKLADRLGIPQSGGSDSHSSKTVGDAYTIVTADERSVEAVLEAIRIGRISPSGEIQSSLDKVRKVFWLGISILRKLFGQDD